MEMWMWTRWTVAIEVLPFDFYFPNEFISKKKGDSPLPWQLCYGTLSRKSYKQSQLIFTIFVANFLS
jgi:hypothetical protein